MKMSNIGDDQLRYASREKRLILRVFLPTTPPRRDECVRWNPIRNFLWDRNRLNQRGRRCVEILLNGEGFGLARAMKRRPQRAIVHAFLTNRRAMHEHFLLDRKSVV